MRDVTVWWLAGLFILSLVLTGLCRLYALRVSMIDIPKERSSHTVPTPRGGGIGLVLTFLVGCGLAAWHCILPVSVLMGTVLAGTLVAAVGIVDDHYQLSAVLRLVLHVVAAALFLSVTDISPVIPLFFVRLNLGIPGLLLAGIFLVWLLNLYNFMDGIDGLAGGETITVTFGAAIILWLHGGYGGVVFLLAVLGVSAAGFLIWNWPPAKIFMGDGGSGFIGFILGCFALLTSGTEGINIWTWMIMFAVFLVDATVTLFFRVLRGERFWKAHRSHAYQILSRYYRSHAKITIGVVLINIFWLFPLAIISSYYPSISIICVLVAMLPLAYLVIRVRSRFDVVGL